jgi:hypothetical protein
VALPFFPGLTEAQADRVAGALLERLYGERAAA